MKNLTLVYGMRLLEGEEVAAAEPGQILLESGQTRQVTLHTLEGDREQIKRQLLESIDAFFEIHE